MENRELTKSKIPRLFHLSSPTSPRSQASALPKAQSSIPSPRYKVTPNPTHKISPKQTFNAGKRNDIHKVKTPAATQPLLGNYVESEEVPEKQNAALAFEEPQNEHLIHTKPTEKYDDEISNVGNPISQKDIDDALKGMILPSEQDPKLKNVFKIMDSPASQLSDDDCVLFEKETVDIQSPSDHGDAQVYLADAGASPSTPFLVRKESTLVKSYGPEIKLVSHQTLEEIRNVTPPPLQQSHEDLIAHLPKKNVVEELVQEKEEKTTNQLSMPSKPSVIHIQKQGTSKSCPLHETSSHKSIGFESRCKSASTQSPAETPVARSEPVEDLRKCEDVNILFSPTPIKMDSTQSITNREPKKPTEPTYLQLHQQKLQKIQAEMTKPNEKKATEPSWQEATVFDSDDESTDEIEEVVIYDRVEEQTQTSFACLDYTNPKSRSLQAIDGLKAEPEERQFGNGFGVHTSPESIDFMESDYDFDDDEGEDIGTTIIESDTEEKLTEYLLRANPDIPSKKQKTIYSLEVPPRISNLDCSGKEALGPGNNGDGYDIRPQKSTTRKVEADPEFEELFKRGNDIQNEYVIAKPGPSTGFITPNEPSQPAKILSRMNSKGCIEILTSSSSSELHADDFCGAAPAESKKSAFIMQRDSNLNNVFHSSKTISNFTSQVCAYKVYMNKSAANHYSVTRKQGFIYPNRDVVLDVKTRQSARVTSQLAIKDEIAVKIFPAYCNDESELANYYVELSQQRPDLIQTHNIDKIVLWDAGDLVSMKNLLDSIKNEDEQIALKEQLHREYSRRVIPEVNSKRLLNKVQSEMQMANASLRQVFNQLVLVRNSTYTLIYGIFFMFIFSMILPLLHTTTVVREEPVVEETIYEKIISFFKTLGL